MGSVIFPLIISIFLASTLTTPLSASTTQKPLLEIGKTAMTDSTSAESVCSSDEWSALSLAIVEQPGSVLEIFCEISFNYFPLFSQELSIFEKNSREEFSQSIALSIVSLDTVNFNSVVLILLEAYKISNVPGLSLLIENIELAVMPQLTEQREHSSAVEFLDATMIWGTSFLFAYRGLPLLAQKISAHPKFPWQNLKIKFQKPIRPTNGGVQIHPNGTITPTVSPLLGKELVRHTITSLVQSPRWYHYYIAGAGAAALEGANDSLSIKLLDLPYLKEAIDVDTLCEASIVISEMVNGTTSARQSNIDSVKEMLVRFKESGSNKFANYFPSKQLKPISNMQDSELSIWSDLYKYYPDHIDRCQQLSFPVVMGMIEQLEKRLSPLSTQSQVQ